MANLETAYELSGLADYLLASPGLVPVEGWPYEEMFKALTDDDGTHSKAQPSGFSKRSRSTTKRRITGNRTTKCRTRSSAQRVLSPSSKHWGTCSARTAQASIWLRRDSAPARSRRRHGWGSSARGPGSPGPEVVPAPSRSVARSTRAARRTDATTRRSSLQALGNAEPETCSRQVGYRGRHVSTQHPAHSAGLVIDHTGKEFGGVSVFVFPSTTKDQRDSMLTRLADEKAYRRLAISKDTKWADIALEKMPVQQVRPAQDVSKAIALFEQLERLGVGTDPRSAARANAYLRRRARFSRNADPTEADFAEAAQYAAIAESRCAPGRLRGSQGRCRLRQGRRRLRQGRRRLRRKGGADFADKGGADFGPG